MSPRQALPQLLLAWGKAVAGTAAPTCTRSLASMAPPRKGTSTTHTTTPTTNPATGTSSFYDTARRPSSKATTTTKRRTAPTTTTTSTSSAIRQKPDKKEEEPAPVPVAKKAENVVVVVTNSAQQASQSFYRRQLPTSHCVPFSSSEGRRMFQEALAQGGMESYFPLSEQFKTQDDPAFCGLGALTMVLNALAIDPGRTWKGPWRWFDESMLECCEPLEVVRERGICISKLDCLARCNGAATVLKYGDSTGLDEFRQDIVRITTGGHGPCQHSHDPAHHHHHAQEQEELMIVGYNRQVLGQTGTGHFSPVGGYHAGKDMVLIMDVARFKYPPHWVSVPLLWEAMQTVDSETQRSRGYLVVAKGMVSESLLFTIDKSRYAEFNDLATWMRKAAIRLPALLVETEITGPRGESSVDHQRLLPLFLESLPESIASMFVTIHESFCLRYSEKHLSSIDQLLVAIEAHPIYTAMGEQHAAQLDRFRTACSSKKAAEEACCAGKVVNERHVLTMLYISTMEWVLQRQGKSILGLASPQGVSPALQLEVAQLKRKFAAMADEV